MVMGVGTWGIVVGFLGGVLLVLALLLAGRWGARRSVGTAGAGLLLLGLAMSGIVGIVVQAVGVGHNPVRWVGLAAAGLGVLLLGSVGVLPGRRRRADVESRRQPGRERPVEQDSGRRTPAPHKGDDDMAEIEDILRRRGIQ